MLARARETDIVRAADLVVAIRALAALAAIAFTTLLAGFALG
jgi:hypothetical protein